MADAAQAPVERPARSDESPDGAPVVAVDEVHKGFVGSDGAMTSVLRGVSLVIRAGEKASLMGPSGCGKSTLLAVIAGLLIPDAGTVCIDGVSLATLDDTERARIRSGRIGIALQSDNLIPFLSARENIELALRFSPGSSRRRRRTHALALLERFGVAHRASHRPRQLSGGETQRVALAVALANRPALLLADEVVAQLDTDTATAVVDDVLGDDVALLCVTHDPALADRFARRMCMVDGTVMAR